MEVRNVWLVICISLVLVVGLNAAIFALFVKKNSVSEIDLFRRAARNIRHPWAREDESLSRLSEMVTDLKKDQDT